LELQNPLIRTDVGCSITRQLFADLNSNEDDKYRVWR